ncbi:MAG: hypothetical protein WC756_19110 [Taibaiella sp.]|jgi:hypothetical protein
MWAVWKDRFDNFTNVYNLTFDATSQVNDMMKPYVSGDTTAWFTNELKNGVDLRNIPKDSLPYYHNQIYKTPEGYYGQALSR